MSREERKAYHLDEGWRWAVSLHGPASHRHEARTLEERVIRAAEAALADHHYVGALDIFVGMGLLAPAHVREWRNGRIPYLEQVIQGNLHKISRSMHVFENGRGHGG